MGGTITKESGGKFANGARMAAFASLVASAAQSSVSPAKEGTPAGQQADLAKRQGLAQGEIDEAYKSGQLTVDNSLFI